MQTWAGKKIKARQTITNHYLLHKSHREAAAIVLRVCRQTSGIAVCQLMSYITFVLCTGYVLLIVKRTKEITCQIF